MYKNSCQTFTLHSYFQGIHNTLRMIQLMLCEMQGIGIFFSFFFKELDIVVGQVFLGYECWAQLF